MNRRIMQCVAVVSCRALHRFAAYPHTDSPRAAIRKNASEGSFRAAGILGARHVKTAEELVDTRESPPSEGMIGADGRIYLLI